MLTKVLPFLWQWALNWDLVWALSREYVILLCRGFQNFLKTVYADECRKQPSTSINSKQQRQTITQILKQTTNEPSWPLTYCDSILQLSWLLYWAAEQQFSWIIAPWWLSVSLRRICITFVWPRSTFCINKTVPGFLDVTRFLSLDVTILII